MVHSKQHISDLAELFFQLEAEYVVISPGSRNGPLISTFTKRFREKCISIVDERSAAYFALGLAKKSGKPAVLICTSGTATLNYSPALAEAYYQHVPLIALTADRPPEWIDQQDNQTIRQQNIYENYIKASFELPLQTQTQNELELVHKIAITAYRKATQICMGPVHINIPLAEPLYEPLPRASAISIETELPALTEINIKATELLADWNKAKSILLVHGQNAPDKNLLASLTSLAKDGRIVLIAENISNIHYTNSVSEPDLLFAHTSGSSLPKPELVIYSGGQVVSKKLKLYLRSLKNTKFWRIGPDEFHIDTYKQDNKILDQEPGPTYDLLGKNLSESIHGKFHDAWNTAKLNASEKRDNLIKNADFSDLKATEILLQSAPENSIIELGNSSAIRYSQLFNSRHKLTYFSNRGVSGIDGCLSTAAGTAHSNKNITLALVGDMSLGYDSNALWNKKLSSKLRIAVLNNSGGGIFDLIDGPSDQDAFEEFFLAHHPLNMEKLAEAYNLDYFYCENEEQLKSLIPKFMGDLNRAALLEIKTKRGNNTKVFFDLINRIRKLK